jgi:hypothetical protein
MEATWAALMNEFIATRIFSANPDKMHRVGVTGHDEWRHGAVATGLVQSLCYEAVRRWNSAGVTPVQCLNALWNAVQSEKPVATAASCTERPGVCSA